MAYGEGANWEGSQQIIVSDGVTFDVTIESKPTTGAARIKIFEGDNPALIATRLANEWNERQPIKDVLAVAEPASGLTAFVLMGPLADGTHQITSMAATFDGQPRQEMVQIGRSVTSFLNTGLSVTRTGIRINSTTSTEKSKQAASVVGGTRIENPVRA